MSGLRLRGVAGAVVVAGAAAAGYMAFVRPRIRDAGATSDEIQRPLPGDDLVQNPAAAATNAITINATAAEVWPWLIQMGSGRAGWYSYDGMDNGGVPSANCIIPELQHLQAGSFVPSVPGGKHGFTVASLDPPRALVYRTTIMITRRGMVTGRPEDIEGERHLAYIDTSWAFVLEDSAPGATRLITRTRTTHHPPIAMALFNLLLSEPTHFMMQRRQLRNIMMRSEAASAHPTRVNAD